MIVCESSVTLRAEADAESDSLRTIWTGKVAHLLDVEGDWYKVSYGSRTGYVFTEYLK